MDIALKARVAHTALRVGAAFAFIYPAVNAWSDPNAWIGYFPPFVLSWGAALGLDNMVVLHIFGVVELGIGAWLLWGRHLFWPSALATVMLVAIVVFNIPQMQIVFRDLSIAAMTLALALTHLPRKAQAVQ